MIHDSIVRQYATCLGLCILARLQEPIVDETSENWAPIGSELPSEKSIKPANWMEIFVAVRFTLQVFPNFPRKLPIVPTASH
jgi:hypothetical protein